LKFDFYIVGDITIEKATSLCESILSKATKKNLSIFLSSAGGDVDAALAIGSVISFVQRQGKTVHIHVGAIAHSAAVMVLQFANHRSMENFATLRIHPLWSEYAGAAMTISELNAECDALRYAHYLYYDQLKRRSGYDVESLCEKSHHLRQDIFLYPDDCLKWNLIDEVLDYALPSTIQESATPGGDLANNVVDFPRPRGFHEANSIQSYSEPYPFSPFGHKTFSPHPATQVT
jgi:ATP-dependent protease ClpP protease subunit